MNKLWRQIVIPDGLNFSALKLARKGKDVSFDWTALDAVCQASGLSPAILRRSSEDNTSGLIVAWYIHHRDGGGSVDPVAEAMLAEAVGEPADIVGDLGRAIWGDRWQRAAASALGIAERTVRRWVAGTETPRPRVIAELVGMAKAKRDEISALIDRLDGLRG